MNTKIKETATLITCYNRKYTTIRCLHSLFSQKLSENYLLKAFLVDGYEYLYLNFKPHIILK